MCFIIKEREREREREREEMFSSMSVKPTEICRNQNLLVVNTALIRACVACEIVNGYLV